jgi:hypothetical protein
MIYLSWSPIYYGVALLLWLLFSGMIVSKCKNLRKKLVWIAIIVFVVINTMAFRVGVRQEYLDRSSFNSAVETGVEKVEAKRFNAADAAKDFDKAIKDNK